MIFKSKLEDYSESEFREFLGCLLVEERVLPADEFEEFIIKAILHFEAVTEHPYGCGLILHPKEGQGEGADGIIKEIIVWRAANNKPGFKSE